jgi:integration host factor subunit beta
MTRSELIQRLAEKHPDLPVAKLEAAVKFLLEHLRETLVEGDRIEVRGFGSFSIRTHDSKQGRNPKTGEPVFVPLRRSVHFKPGKELRDRVNQH